MDVGTRYRKLSGRSGKRLFSIQLELRKEGMKAFTCPACIADRGFLQLRDKPGNLSYVRRFGHQSSREHSDALLWLRDRSNLSHVGERSVCCSKPHNGCACHMRAEAAEAAVRQRKHASARQVQTPVRPPP